MTALSGFARSFAELALARIGVGIGEASAAPAAFSLLSDYFPPARRATVLAIYSSGIYIGAGLGLGVGGLIVERWDAAFAGRGAASVCAAGRWRSSSWGCPGLLLALWVRTLREPVRGGSEAMVAATRRSAVPRVRRGAARRPAAAHAAPPLAARRAPPRVAAQPGWRRR